MTETIRTRLAQGLQPLHLEVVNESSKHAGHAGDDGSGMTHFRVLIVSGSFNGKSRIERERMVHTVLKQEIINNIHALSVKAVAEDEYDRM